jgi:ABC-type amino acid transport substrate-binding protein
MKIKFILMFFISTLIANENINIYTEEYPPYNMKKGDELKGIVVDVVEAILKEIKSKQSKSDIVLTNWSRAYMMAQKKKNSMVFSTMRTKERDKHFKWVGPIAPTTKNIIALKSKNIKIKTPRDLNKYKIGTVLKDSAEELLGDLGVKKSNLKSIGGKNALELSLKKLLNGRIDMFAYNSNVAQYYSKENGIDWNKFEIVYVLKETDVYLAFNNQTNDKIINKWQKAFELIKLNGTYQRILEKY